MDPLDEFRKDLDENKKQGGNRADFFKLKNGDNKVVILTNPVGYSEVFKIGIAYEGCGYGQFAGRRYKCYVKDIEDGKIKIANFSYTVAGGLNALSEGARTKFATFPMPYMVNFKTENAGTKEVKTSVIADEDYTVTPEDQEELDSYDSIREILDRLKASQKKKVENDPELQEKIEAYIKTKDEENAARLAKKKQDGEKAEHLDTIEYPEEEINLTDIPF